MALFITKSENMGRMINLVLILLAIVAANIKLAKSSLLESRNSPKTQVLPQPPKQNIYPDFRLFQETAGCGGVFNTSNGGFSHKPFEKVLDNERCSWIIGVSGAVGYTISIQYLGSPTNEPESGQELVITGIRYDRPEATVSTYFPNSAGTFTVTDSNIVVVTFASDMLNERPSTGFALRYQDIQIGNVTKTSPLSTHAHFRSPTFNYKYPPNSERYDSFEFAGFLFPVVGDKYNGRAKHILYELINLGSNCYDYLDVYVFDHALSWKVEGKWKRTNRICATSGSTLDIPNDETVLILFHSDNSRDGFKFSFMGC